MVKVERIKSFPTWAVGSLLIASQLLFLVRIAKDKIIALNICLPLFKVALKIYHYIFMVQNDVFHYDIVIQISFDHVCSPISPLAASPASVLSLPK